MPPEGMGHHNSWVMKTDAEGNIKGIYPYLSSNTIQTSDGGYLLAGQERSYSPRYTFPVILTRLDIQGRVQWIQSYQWNDRFGVMLIRQTSDDGYILGVSSFSFENGSNTLLVKINATGNFEWKEIYLGQRSVAQTSDGGFTFVGEGEFMKTDINGVIQ